jgi:hypothetical protein
VKEQSHKNEMSKALRGDFERLRERGVATTLTPPDEPQAVEEALEPESSERNLGSPPATDAVPSEATAPQPGWFGRLIGR